MSFPFPTFQFAATVGEFALNAAIGAMGRALDLLTTHYVTRQMILETNRRVQQVGWKGAVLMQIPAIVVSAFNFYIAFFIMLWSLFAAVSNLEGSYYIRDKGEEEYYRELQEMVRRTPWPKLIVGEISLLGSMVVAGFLIFVFLALNDVMGIIMVAIALICHGMLKTARGLQYLQRLRSAPLKTPEENDGANDLPESMPEQ
ncbi:MAG TPA: hypothetical protein VKK79_06535 [Candidatus Lokiarchaeia archaeon]|nr:hypothetical protein [Candidatus Lokiarchaeia archaeon]